MEAITGLGSDASIGGLGIDLATDGECLAGTGTITISSSAIGTGEGFTFCCGRGPPKDARYDFVSRNDGFARRMDRMKSCMIEAVSEVPSAGSKP